MFDQSRLGKTLHVFSYILLLLNIALVPLIFDQGLFNYFVIPKQYLFIGLTLITMVAFVAKVIVQKKIQYVRTALDLPVVLFLGAAVVSAIFAPSVMDAFWGRSEFFTLNFVLLAFFGLFYYFLANTLDTPRRWRMAVDVLVGVGAVVAGLFILKTVLGFNFFGLFPDAVWNVIDNTNSAFGLWLIAPFMLAGGQLLKNDLSVGRAIGYFVVVALTICCLLLIGFSVLWYLFIFGAALLLVVGLGFMKEARLGWLSALFGLIVLATVIIFFGSPKLLPARLAVPSEVSLGTKPSWQITSNSLTDGVKGFFIGGGLGSFGNLFSRFRGVEFNSDQMVWAIRFNQPYNSFFALLAEGGIAMVSFFVVIVLVLLGHAYGVWNKVRSSSIAHSVIENLKFHKNDVRLDSFVVLATWLLVTVGAFFIYYSVSLWWLWWLLMGLAITGMGFLSEEPLKVRELKLTDAPQYNLTISFVAIMIFAGIVMFGVWGSRLYAADHKYATAIRTSNYNEAETILRSAIIKRSNYDLYHVSLAQVYLFQAVEQTRTAKPDIQLVSTLLAKAVSEAKQATAISPRSVAIWENLAMMYENASALVPDARDWAVKSLQSALALEPTNPVIYWRLGNNYSAAGKLSDAQKQYQQAVNLKPDYAEGHIGLANVYEQNKDLTKAIDEYKNIQPTDSNRVEVYFNLGRLLFNRNAKGDRTEAEKIWLEVVRLQPTYSNALYSLGLLYEGRGEKSSALQYYYKVKDLNPDNKDIVAKIKSLIGR